MNIDDTLGWLYNNDTIIVDMVTQPVLFFSLSDIDLLEEEKGTFFWSHICICMVKFDLFDVLLTRPLLSHSGQPMWGTLESNPGACQCLDQRRCWEINLA